MCLYCLSIHGGSMCLYCLSIHCSIVSVLSVNPLLYCYCPVCVSYNKTNIVWWAVWGNRWVCGGDRSPEPAGQRWSAPTTNSVISTYSTSDEGGFVFISYKGKSYARPEPQRMWYCIYYELNQFSFPAPLPFKLLPSMERILILYKGIRMLAITYLSNICICWQSLSNTLIFAFCR